MKKIISVIVLIIMVSGFNTFCFASPFSNIMSFFQRDLVIDVVYANHKNLIQGSQVYLAKDPQGEKILIGKVTKVSLTDSQMSKVQIVIDKKYKQKMYESTSFVLMSNAFLKNSTPHIVAVPPADISNKKLLEKGSLVNGISFLEYKIAIASKGLKQILDNIKTQNSELLDQLDQYIKTLNTDAFQIKMDELMGQVSQFSAEQKEMFKKEVLPSLRKMLDSLKEQNGSQKSKDLEKQLKKIEDMVDV